MSIVPENVKLDASICNKRSIRGTVVVPESPEFGHCSGQSKTEKTVIANMEQMIDEGLSFKPNNKASYESLMQPKRSMKEVD